MGTIHSDFSLHGLSCVPELSPNAFLLQKSYSSSISSFNHPEVSIFPLPSSLVSLLSISSLHYLKSLNQTGGREVFLFHSNKHCLPYLKTKTLMFFLHHTVKFSLVNLEQETHHTLPSILVRNIFIGTRSVDSTHP